MTAQAFAVGDRVEILDGPFKGQEGRVIFADWACIKVDLDLGGAVYFKHGSPWVRLAPLPPTEDVLSALLVEQRKTNDLLAQLLSKPTLTLHGQERSDLDWFQHAGHEEQARKDEKYGHGTIYLHDVYRRKGPQRA